MAITGAIFNSLIYGDVNSADYGVYISGDAVFNAPQRSVELVSVPGRNGSIAIDQGHFENIEVEYPAGMFGDDKTDFRQRLSDFRNAIMSKKGYQRLSDTYHPDEYRMGMYIEGLEVEPTHYNEAGQFTLKFNCKPQRYLTSGEEEIDVTDWSDVKTLSGESVTFDDGDASKGFQSIKTVFNPSQDGTPWKSEVESAPYLFRQSSGGTVEHEYNSESDAIVGGTVAWNQLVQDDAITSTAINGITWSRASGQPYVVNGLATAVSEKDTNETNVIAGHKYLILGGISPNYIDCRPTYVSRWSGSIVDEGNGRILSCVSSGITSVRMRVFEGVNVSSVKITPQLIDLTALFGSATIADYLYNLEQSTAGAGIAKLKEWGFDIDSYHAYDAGSLQSVNTSAHETVGFNQWDEEWEVGSINNSTGLNNTDTDKIRSKNYVPAIPNTLYCIYAFWTRLFFYDAEKNFISYVTVGVSEYATANTFTTPANACYMRFRCNSGYGTTYNNDICINISSDRNGEYEPYIKHSYPLDSDLTLRGIPKLDASNNLYYDGDVYEADGTVTRKYGIVDLGSFNWLEIGGGYWYQQYVMPDVKHVSNSAYANCMCPIYTVDTADNINFKRHDKVIGINSEGRIATNDSGNYASASAYKAAMSGVYLVYELKTETTETADPFTAIQDVSPYGTEEYVDYGVSQGTRDIAVPVGHQTKYIQRVPIEGKTQMKTYVSPTNSVEDATEYTTNLNGTKYGGTLEVISGKLDKTHEGITYTGQTINEPWLSDCDEYQQGATPTYGATVVYELTTPTEVSLTAQAVAMLDGTNVVWADADSVEVKYGVEPGKIYNPTLFDAQPLLMAKGHGNIVLNGQTIVLNETSFGPTVLKQSGSIDSRGGILTFNTELINNGDPISIASIEDYIEIEWPTTNYYAAVISESGYTNAETTVDYYSTGIDSWGNVNYLNTVCVALNDLEFVAGTPKTITHYVTLRLLESASTETWTVLVDYDGNDTFEIDAYASEMGAGQCRIDYSSITAQSTVMVLGNPTYIDCEIGEAYKIEGGQVISLNRFVDLGSDIPVLPPGANSITFDNTITELKIAPNWWKV